MVEATKDTDGFALAGEGPAVIKVEIELIVTVSMIVEGVDGSAGEEPMIIGTLLRQRI